MVEVKVESVITKVDHLIAMSWMSSLEVLYLCIGVLGLWLQRDLLLVVLLDLLTQLLPVIGAAISIIPRILVGHMELLKAVCKVVLSFSHVPLKLLIQLLSLFELQLDDLLICI